MEGLGNSTKVERTKIIPLRWIGNICGEIAGSHILKAVYLDEDQNWGIAYRYHAKMYKLFSKPSDKWGTYYILDRPYR